MSQSLLEQIQELEQSVKEKLKNIADLNDLDKLRVDILGKKGSLTAILRGLGKATPEERKATGQAANAFKDRLETDIADTKIRLEEEWYQSLAERDWYDAERLPPVLEPGRRHPLTTTQREIEELFTSMGFSILDGPEVEADFYNFGALNFTDDHPARDMQDTFWTKTGRLLRTHTSSIQVRGMENLKPPFRVIAPGRVYRYEELDASHEHTFYQVEGMMVDTEINIGHLIFMMKTLLREVLGRETEVRLRPGYFPFVEPGFELDMKCLLCGGKGCAVCKQSGWVEVLPCGLVHPNVLRAGGLNPDEWQGFAFGLGLNRLIMMRHGIEDIRHFQSGNLRFLRQF